MHLLSCCRRVFVSSSDRVISMNLDGSEILMICRAALTGIAWNPKGYNSQPD